MQYTCVTGILKRRQVVEVNGKSYTSRCRLIISAYNSIRARLYNNYKHLEETNIHLFNINETTLIKWYKNTHQEG